MRTKSRANLLVGAVVVAGIFLTSTTANALSISAEFNLAHTSNSIANPVSVHAANDIRFALTPGDLFVLDIIVENAPADVLTAIFATIVFDSTQLSFLGGAFSDILVEASCTGVMCTPAALTPAIPSPIFKPSDPASGGTGTESWVLAIAHTNFDGAAGAGPDRALIMAFQYIGLGGFESIDIIPSLTAGDAIGGFVTGPINFSGAFINVPEPGTTLLFGLGLLGLSRKRRC